MNISPYQSKKINEIAEFGCKKVRFVIATFDAGFEPEILLGVKFKDQFAVVSELKKIMSIKDSCPT